MTAITGSRIQTNNQEILTSTKFTTNAQMLLTGFACPYTAVDARKEPGRFRDKYYLTTAMHSEVDIKIDKAEDQQYPKTRRPLSVDERRELAVSLGRQELIDSGADDLASDESVIARESKLWDNLQQFSVDLKQDLSLLSPVNTESVEDQAKTLNRLLAMLDQIFIIEVIAEEKQMKDHPKAKGALEALGQLKDFLVELVDTAIKSVDSSVKHYDLARIMQGTVSNLTQGISARVVSPFKYGSVDKWLALIKDKAWGPLEPWIENDTVVHWKNEFKKRDPLLSFDPSTENTLTIFKWLYQRSEPTWFTRYPEEPTKQPSQTLEQNSQG